MFQHEERAVSELVHSELLRWKAPFAHSLLDRFSSVLGKAAIRSMSGNLCRSSGANTVNQILGHVRADKVRRRSYGILDMTNDTIDVLVFKRAANHIERPSVVAKSGGFSIQLTRGALRIAAGNCKRKNVLLVARTVDIGAEGAKERKCVCLVFRQKQRGVPLDTMNQFYEHHSRNTIGVQLDPIETFLRTGANKDCGLLACGT